MESAITITELAKIARALTAVDAMLETLAQGAPESTFNTIESLREDLAQASALIVQLAKRAGFPNESQSCQESPNS